MQRFKCKLFFLTFSGQNIYIVMEYITKYEIIWTVSQQTLSPQTLK